MKTKPDSSPKEMRLRTETLTTTLLGLGAIFGQVLNDTVFEVWSRILSDFNEEEFHRAIKEYMIGPSGGFFPKPGQIYALARAEPDRDAESALMVEVLFRVVGTCGAADKFSCERAKASLPEPVWAYVENVGGWPKFARDMQMIGQGDVSIVKSQIRKSVGALMERKKQGRPMMIGQNPGLCSIGDYAKKLLPEGEGS